jgi:hypothetical protein
VHEAEQGEKAVQGVVGKRLTYRQTGLKPYAASV